MSFPYEWKTAAMISTFWASQQTKLTGDCQFGKDGIKTGSKTAFAESQSLGDDAGTGAMSQHPNHLFLDRGKSDSGKCSADAERGSAGFFYGHVHADSPPKNDGVEGDNPTSVRLFR
jgi:hypothetical protein